jgi:hypothetical protein
MSSLDNTTDLICVFGVAGADHAVEVYGVNASREVTMHGWFRQSIGVCVLAQRPACLIAVDSESLSDELIGELRRSGHSVIVMPTTGLPSQSSYKRSAKDVCQLAIGLAGSYTRPQTRSVQ